MVSEFRDDYSFKQKYEDRETFFKRKKEERVRDAEKALADEREVLEYLKSKGSDGAVRRVEENIKKLEKTLEKYKKDL